MKLLGFLTLLALALPAWGQEGALMEMGADVYQNHCVTCHGAEGQGGLGTGARGQHRVAERAARACPNPLR